ncbi:YajG family lipoprotein [Pseudomonas sp. CC6-YY-74]|uniref:YajG family lipoprotein n=1 Tax=Pseudomonas sp. CC6-YY-74 TaxID=1930532 RepID=UPI0009A150B2|nr:YajG family lipoprotein [Pseudomonas sp. CC6-YY-74]
MKKITFIAALIITCSGCAFKPQAVQVSPDLKLNHVMEGQGSAINLLVVDERSSQSLGARGAGAGAELTLQGNLEQIITSAIESGLKQQGFVTPAQPERTNTRLRVEIRNLDYKVIAGVWSGTIRAESGLKAICKASSGVEYEKLYNGVFQEKGRQLIGSDVENNAFVSSAVSDATNRLLNDAELGRCLADQAADKSTAAK